MVTFSKLGQLGFLGNQMFQIAAVVGLAKLKDQGYIFPSWKYQEDFENKLPLGSLSAPIYNEPSYSYTPIAYNTPHIDLYGYFQSEKYFKHCEKDIRTIFEPSERIKLLMNELKTKYPNSTSIHIRRGDYLNFPDVYPAITKEYLLEAVKLTNSSTYLVFSDDPIWCKENLDLPNMKILHYGPVEDLFLMSSADNNIIANSSFSWWAAWLNSNENKIVVAPKNWFGNGPAAPKNWSDIYCEGWKVI